MFREQIHSKQLLDMFHDSVNIVLDELELQYEKLKARKEDDRTFDYHTQKILTNYFRKNGGLPL